MKIEISSELLNEVFSGLISYGGIACHNTVEKLAEQAESQGDIVPSYVTVFIQTHNLT